MRSLNRPLLPMIRSTVLLVIFTATASLPTMTVANDACVVRIEASDTLRFNRNEILVPDTCETFTVELVHTGILPKAVTPQNWVLTRYNSLDAVARAAYQAGEERGWLRPDDPRILAATPLIGRGESARVNIDVTELDPETVYGFLSTVGGHSPRMRGTLRIVSDMPDS